MCVYIYYYYFFRFVATGAVVSWVTSHRHGLPNWRRLKLENWHKKWVERSIDIINKLWLKRKKIVVD